MKRNVFYISDLHLFHDNVIRFTNEGYSQWVKNEDGTVCLLGRKWKMPEIPTNQFEWQNKIRDNWNAHVGRDDIVYVIGDLVLGSRFDFDTLCSYLASLNGEIRLIPGNHDGYFMKQMEKKPGENFVRKYEPDTRYGKFTFGPSYFETYTPMPEGKNAQFTIMSHFPLFCYPGCGYRDVTHIYGHIHNMGPQIEAYHNMIMNTKFTSTGEGMKAEAYNVGCMLPWMDFTPRTIDELRKAFND